MRNKTSTRETGMLGEEIAAQFLTRKGYTVIARNYRRPSGEIDLVATKGDVVHFVEVKSVSREKGADVSREPHSGRDGMDYRPEELVHTKKLRKIARTATLYMEEKKDDREFQIDVVGVLIEKKSHTARCRLFEQVLEGELL